MRMIKASKIIVSAISKHKKIIFPGLLTGAIIFAGSASAIEKNNSRRADVAIASDLSSPTPVGSASPDSQLSVPEASATAQSPTPTTTPIKSVTPLLAKQNNQQNIKQVSTPAPAKPAPTAAPAESGILGYVNQARAENGLNQLTYNPILNNAAQAKSEDMQSKNYFSHTAPDGKSDFDFIRSAGYIFTFAGSNIAEGDFGGIKGVFDAWMNSPDHRANILNVNAREFGYGSAGNYFTMMVGAR